MSERQHTPHPSHGELFYPSEIPFNLAGELIDNGLTQEGEKRVAYLAHVETLNAQTHYNYQKQCWIENGRVARCGHREKESGCYACNHVGEKEHETVSDVFPILTGNKSSAAPVPAEYAGPFPRKRHSHRCPYCSNAVACYRAHCRKPQRIERAQCQFHS